MTLGRSRRKRWRTSRRTVFFSERWLDNLTVARIRSQHPSRVKRGAKEGYGSAEWHSFAYGFGTYTMDIVCSRGRDNKLDSLAFIEGSVLV
jgi:hypothetical protein